MSEYHYCYLKKAGN